MQQENDSSNIRAALAVLEDANELQLRPEDAAAVSGRWRENVALSISRDGGVAFRDREGNLIALYGISYFGPTASPWLLCSPLIEKHQATVWRRAKHIVRTIREVSPPGLLIFNWIPKDSAGNRAFLLALGFVILPSPRDGFDFFFLPPTQQASAAVTTN